MLVSRLDFRVPLLPTQPLEPADPEVVATTTDYGGEFASSVWQDNVFACQFHPEKSQAIGLQILANFAALAGESDASAAVR